MRRRKDGQPDRRGAKRWVKQPQLYPQYRNYGFTLWQPRDPARVPMYIHTWFGTFKV